MKEKLRLVEEFSDLRAGDLVVLKPCVLCNGGHRGILVEWTTEECETAAGTFDSLPGWVMAPETACGSLVIDADVVAEHTVYKVDTGLELSQEQTTSRPLEDAR